MRPGFLPQDSTFAWFPLASLSPRAVYLLSLPSFCTFSSFLTFFLYLVFFLYLLSFFTLRIIYLSSLLLSLLSSLSSLFFSIFFRAMYLPSFLIVFILCWRLQPMISTYHSTKHAGHSMAQDPCPCIWSRTLLSRRWGCFVRRKGFSHAFHHPSAGGY